jgi:hypothetical protein
MEKQEETKEEKIWVIDKERIVHNPERTMAIFWIDEEATKIQFGEEVYNKVDKLKFLREVQGDDRIEIFDKDVKMLVLSGSYYDKLKLVFENMGNSWFGMEYFISGRDLPIIIKSGNLGGIIAPRVEMDDYA